MKLKTLKHGSGCNCSKCINKNGILITKKKVKIILPKLFAPRTDNFPLFLEEMQKIHDKKNHDYAKSSNKYSNFDISAELVKHFTDPKDQVFVTLISTKLARLSELLGKDKAPNNESIHDTFIDLSNYCVLWAGSRERKL